MPALAERLRGSQAVKQRKRRLKAEPLCRHCLEQGIVTIATVPDHIRALALGGTDDDSNIQCLCEDCHDKKTRAEFGLRPARPRINPADGWPYEG